MFLFSVRGGPSGRYATPQEHCCYLGDPADAAAARYVALATSAACSRHVRTHRYKCSTTKYASAPSLASGCCRSSDAAKRTPPSTRRATARSVPPAGASRSNGSPSCSIGTTTSRACARAAGGAACNGSVAGLAMPLLRALAASARAAASARSSSSCCAALSAACKGMASTRCHEARVDEGCICQTGSQPCGARRSC